MTATIDRATAGGIAALTLVGLAFRIAMGNGSLWLDEAWSLDFAKRAGDAAGVFLRVNHDNNHHLNTLWLQMTGPGAPPLIIRAVAILCGTAAIPVAALVALRAGRAAAIVTAALFALSPFFVLYGSEARGYAAAFLAMLVVILMAQRWLDEATAPRRRLAVIATLGAFSHLFIVPSLIVISGWAAVARATTRPWRAALTDTVRTFDLALITAAMILGIALAGAASLGGMVFGSLTAWTAAGVYSGIRELVSMVLGLGWPPIMWPALIVTAALLAVKPWPTFERSVLWFFLIAAFPIAAMLFQLDNSQYARYYYPSGLGLLLLFGERVGVLYRAAGARRAFAVLVGSGLCATMIAEDARIIEVGRGNVNRALRLMAVTDPVRPAVVQLLNERERPTLAVAAAQTRLPLVIAWQRCDPRARFLFGSRLSGLGGQRLERCGGQWRLLASNPIDELSTEPWLLYRRDDLPLPRGVANGPPPTR